MSTNILISDVTFGGNGDDNPDPLTRANYHLTPGEQLFQYINMNIIAPYPSGGTKSVTALIQIDPKTGNPLLGPNDYCKPPCPPWC